MLGNQYPNNMSCENKCQFSGSWMFMIAVLFWACWLGSCNGEHGKIEKKIDNLDAKITAIQQSLNNSTNVVLETK